MAKPAEAAAATETEAPVKRKRKASGPRKVRPVNVLVNNGKVIACTFNKDKVIEILTQNPGTELIAVIPEK